MEKLIMEAEEWPHGLICMDCKNPIIEGMAYSKRLVGFVDEIPLSEVICIHCALGQVKP